METSGDGHERKDSSENTINNIADRGGGRNIPSGPIADVPGQQAWAVGDQVLCFEIRARGHVMPVMCAADETSVEACIKSLWAHTQDWLSPEIAAAWTTHIWKTYWRSIP